MPNLVRIDASALSQGSHSKALADLFERQWRIKHPQGQVQHHDLSQLNLPHIDEAFIEAMYTAEKDRNIQQHQLLEQSNHFVNELKAADTLLISTPMYNFSIPSHLKTYIDMVTRVGETFRYGEKGPEGLLKIAQTVVMVASGGDYTQPPMDSMNFVTPYLKTVLGFNGIDSPVFIEAAGMAMGEEKQQLSLKQAQQKIKSLLSQQDE